MTRRRRVSVLLALPLLVAVSCGFWSSPSREDLTDARMSAKWAANREKFERLRALVTGFEGLRRLTQLNVQLEPSTGPRHGESAMGPCRALMRELGIDTVRRQQGAETFVYLDVVSSGSATFAQSRGYLHAPSLDVGFPVVVSVDTVATGRRGAGAKPLGDGWWLYYEAD
ncbi:MAG: hypothetical protein U0229_11650 [Anaeromyxobacter sp.]